MKHEQAALDRNDSIIVRVATDGDIGALAKLAERAFRDAYASQNDAQDIEDYVDKTLSPQKFRGDFEDSKNIFLVAVLRDEERLAGYAKLRDGASHARSNTDRSIEVERLYVDSILIGKGVGATMMQACLDTARSLGKEEIWLGVWEHNQRAIDFYRRWEFSVVGEHRFTLGSDIQTDLIMSRTETRYGQDFG